MYDLLVGTEGVHVFVYQHFPLKFEPRVTGLNQHLLTYTNSTGGCCTTPILVIQHLPNLVKFPMVDKFVLTTRQAPLIFVRSCSYPLIFIGCSQQSHKTILLTLLSLIKEKGIATSYYRLRIMLHFQNSCLKFNQLLHHSHASNTSLVLLYFEKPTDNNSYGSTPKF
jgi:hypothetical protein